MQGFVIIFLIFFYLFSITFGLNIHFYSNLVSMTNKKGAGGAREGAGRPPKILEIKLIEQMDAICVPDKIWEALLYKCQQGDTNALKLWLSYRFGLPKQQIDITSNGDKIAPPIQWIGKRVAIESAKVVSEEEEETNQQLDELQIKVQKDYQNLVDQDKENKQFDIWL
jgi:hypothetical protein